MLRVAAADVINASIPAKKGQPVKRTMDAEGERQFDFHSEAIARIAIFYPYRSRAATRRGESGADSDCVAGKHLKTG